MKKLRMIENIVGIIGGSGFYNLDEIKKKEILDVETPYGKPSEKIVTGKLGDTDIAFLSRHGLGHKYNPSEVNYRANLYALKLLGVEKLISSTAVGSLKEKLKPTHIVIPDQYVDNTFKRDKTFFEKGIVAHVSMANPVCPHFSKAAYDIAKKLDLDVHLGGTYFNMEGPQFSSKAESGFYRNSDYSVIGMTQAVEAKLAKELEMCFIPLAFVTDYDCWHPETDNVTAEMVVENLNKNISNGLKLILSLVKEIGQSKRECSCDRALDGSILTDINSLSDEVLVRIQPVIKKYIAKEI